MCAFNSICVVLLLFPLLAVSRICSVASPCTLGVAQCSEAQFTNNCSYVFNNQRSFANQARAIAACQSKFGAASTLVTPGDVTTNNMVRTLCASHRFFDMRRRTGAGNTCLQWQTFAGEPITYFNWDNGEPTPNNCNEDCAGFRADAAGKWHDSFCTPTAGSVSFLAQCVVCAIEPMPASTPQPTPVPTPVPTPMPTRLFTFTVTTRPPTDGTTTSIIFSVSDTSSISNSPPSSSVGDIESSSGGVEPWILGVIISGAVLAVVLVGLVVFCIIKRRRTEQPAGKPAAELKQEYAAISVRPPDDYDQLHLKGTYDVVPGSRGDYVAGRVGE